MSNYELTISANDNTVVSLKINNRKSIFFGSKKFILEVNKSSNIGLFTQHTAEEFDMKLTLNPKEGGKSEIIDSVYF